MKYLIYSKSHALFGLGSLGRMGYMELLTEQFPLFARKTGGQRYNGFHGDGNQYSPDTLQRA